jgi:CheY-like chemotaxis protein
MRKDAVMPAISFEVFGPKPSPAVPDSPISRPGAPCVLVVEDMPMLRSMIAQLLSRQGGYVVREAGSYLEAEALLLAVDAVATDGYYPHHAGDVTGPWGLALARLARTQGKRTVLLSGDSALIERAHTEGIQALRKPEDILELVAALAEAGVPQSLEPAVR